MYFQIGLSFIHITDPTTSSVNLDHTTVIMSTPPKLKLSAKFRSLQQKENETIQNFMIRISEYATKCGFGQSQNIMVRDQFMFGLKSKRA